MSNTTQNTTPEPLNPVLGEAHIANISEQVRVDGEEAERSESEHPPMGTTNAISAGSSTGAVRLSSTGTVRLFDGNEAHAIHFLSGGAGAGSSEDDHSYPTVRAVDKDRIYQLTSELAEAKKDLKRVLEAKKLEAATCKDEIKRIESEIDLILNEQS